jgi:pimeloyl-ACP methyl ester carboxylesterase
MSTITVKDGTEIYYKDWGEGPVVTFSHGWPLNADAWDGQLLFLAQHGYRVVPYGAAHESEVQYLFDLSDTPNPGTLTAPQQRLAQAMRRDWTSLAKSGRPGAS